MALTSAQIVSLALQTSKTGGTVNGVNTGYTVQAGQFLNAILSELCQEHDFDVAKGTFNFTLAPAAAKIGNLNAQLASGPFTLPADYLRAKIGDVIMFPLGLGNFPIKLIPIDLEEFDSLVQTAGFENFPVYWVTDMSQSPPIAYVWPPASGAYNTMVRYYRQMPDIATPETATAVPWFPNTQFLITELSGRLMQLAGDDRWEAFLSDNEEAHPGGSRVLLRRYLVLKDDTSNRSKTVKLDPRRFGPNRSALPKSKILGY